MKRSSKMWTNGSFPHIVCGYIKVTIKSSLKMHMITTNAQNTMKNKLKRFFMNLNAKRRTKKKNAFHKVSCCERKKNQNVKLSTRRKIFQNIKSGTERNLWED
jgi:hypothetical protein